MGPVHDSMRKELPSISKFQHHAIVVYSRQPVPWDDFRLARDSGRILSASEDLFEYFSSRTQSSLPSGWGCREL